MSECTVGVCSIQNKRDEQQDRFTYCQSEFGNFFAVADGMGGHENGDEAADEAIFAFSRLTEPFETVEAACEWMYTLSESIRQNGVAAGEFRSRGTTLTAGIHNPVTNTMMILHCGDSRAYRLRDGVLEYLTFDHTAPGVNFREGKFNQEQYESARGYMGILSHMGMPPYFGRPNVKLTTKETAQNVKVEVTETPVIDGDVYLFCTDGVSGRNSFEWIQEILSQKATSQIKAQLIAKALVDRAVEVGNTDNATCIVACF